MSRRLFMRDAAALVIVCIFSLTQTTQLLAVEYANIEVDAAGNVTIPGGQSTSDFAVTGNGTTGVIPIQIGASSNDDAAGGVLIGAISENGRLEDL